MTMPSAIDDAKVDALLERAHREVDDGLLPSVQLALAYDGEIVVDDTYGDATPGTRYAVFSATKAFVASTVWTLIGDGSLDVSKRVVDYIPEFGTNGKDVITVEQVMLHLGGFPMAPLGAPTWTRARAGSRRFARWRLNWEPGSTYEYHPTSAHWVLAELIERITGTDFRDVVEERVTAPMVCPACSASPTTRAVADLVSVGEAATPRGDQSRIRRATSCPSPK